MRQECNSGAPFRKCLFPRLVKPGPEGTGEDVARGCMYFPKKGGFRGIFVASGRDVGGAGKGKGVRKKKISLFQWAGCSA
jgi:hypothetical protein